MNTLTSPAHEAEPRDAYGHLHIEETRTGWVLTAVALSLVGWGVALWLVLDYLPK